MTWGEVDVRDRYRRDPAFRTLVDTLYGAIRSAVYTPTEIREAAMLAQIMYEQERPRVWVEPWQARDRP